MLPTPVPRRLRHRLLSWSCLLTTTAAACAFAEEPPARSAVPTAAPEEPAATSSPLFQEAITEFRTMTATLYQYQTRVDRAAGSYRYDCVGFVSYALKRATPQAWDSVFKATG